MFETENMIIDSESSEMVATIISAVAQNESRNISENITWGYKRKFERGEPLLNYKRFISYVEKLVYAIITMSIANYTDSERWVKFNSSFRRVR